MDIFIVWNVEFDDAGDSQKVELECICTSRENADARCFELPVGWCKIVQTVTAVPMDQQDQGSTRDNYKNQTISQESSKPASVPSA